MTTNNDPHDLQVKPEELIDLFDQTGSKESYRFAGFGSIRHVTVRNGFFFTFFHLNIFFIRVLTTRMVLLLLCKGTYNA